MARFYSSENDMIGKLYSKDHLSDGIRTSKDYNVGLTLKPPVVEDLRARAVYNRIDGHWDKRFTRVPIIDPYTTLQGTREYLFFTKPDLHLYGNNNGGYSITDFTNKNTELTSRSSFFADALERYPRVVDQLQYSKSSGDSGGPLSPLLSNAVASNLDLPSISADTIDTPQNVYGTKIEYRGTSYKSDEGFDFSLTFKDTKYLEVYMWFKMYDEYERMKWKGQVTPTRDEYRRFKILHDQMAIYKFIVADDGMSLVYYARIMGCFPTSVPRETFNRLEPGEIQYDVNWHGFDVQELDPVILADFNNITRSYRESSGNGALRLYDVNNHAFNPEWALCPFIYQRENINNELDQMNKYYLLWSKAREEL